MKILFAEDTIDLNRAVSALLSHEGYDVDSVYDGESACEKFMDNSYDAIILDIMMPKRDGISVLKEIRKNNLTVPVLMLTAKSEIDDRVEGLSLGADDYLSKPFAMKELLARVSAMIRRTTKYDPNEITYLDILLNGETLELRSRNSVRLSLKEYELLKLLISREGHLVKENVIKEHIWKDNNEGDSDTVYLYINYLRRKLKQIASKVEIIGNRDEGYGFLKSPNT